MMFSYFFRPWIFWGAGACLFLLEISIVNLHPHSKQADQLLQELKAMQKAPGFQSATLGFYLIEEGASEPTLAYQAQTGLIPASVLKAVTTATALELLGPDFCFETTLQTSGFIDTHGVLWGDILLAGGGDPSLGEKAAEDVFSQWYEAIKKAGIRRVAGRVIGNEQIFDTQLIPRTWTWEDMGNYYGAGASGLSIQRNEYSIYFRPDRRVGDPARLTRIDPQVPGLILINEMQTGSRYSGDHGYIFGAPYSNLRYLRGTIPGGRKSFSIRGSFPDPAFYCAEIFADYLKGRGIGVEGAPTTSRRLAMIEEDVPEADQTLLTLYSRPLSYLIQETNYESLNLHAEALLKILSAQELSLPGSTTHGTEVVTAYWKAKGIPMEGFRMEDGSGLSRLNLVSAEQVALILQQMRKSPYHDVFLDSLPRSGLSGTLKKLGANTIAEGRLFAKSGTLRRVKAYAGYVQTYSNQIYVFAFFVNNYSGTHRQVFQKMEDILIHLVEL